MYADLFRDEIRNRMNQAKSQGFDYVEIVSGDVHRTVGGYPGQNHRMPTCCEVMYSLMKGKDLVLESPPKGKGATLLIRYFV